MAHPSFDHSDTLALALAATGDFSAAQAHQEKLLELAKVGQAPAAVVARLQKHLDQYLRHEPVRSGSKVP